VVEHNYSTPVDIVGERRIGATPDSVVSEVIAEGLSGFASAIPAKPHLWLIGISFPIRIEIDKIVWIP
jgi:hypothetical protein